MDIDGFTVEALTSGRFDDLGAVLGKGGIGGCWCMYWTTSTTAEWRENCRGGSTAPNKSGMPDLVATGPPPGLLAYHDGHPVARCRGVGGFLFCRHRGGCVPAMAGGERVAGVKALAG